MSLEERVKGIVETGSRYIDYKMGAIGATVMGSLIAGINYDADPLFIATAASKQAAYTFFLGGAVMKACESIATRVRGDYLAMGLAIAIPSAATMTATYGVHNLKGTPKPFESTVPTMLIAPPACAYWARRKRKQLKEADSTQ